MVGETLEGCFAGEDWLDSPWRPEEEWRKAPPHGTEREDEEDDADDEEALGREEGGEQEEEEEEDTSGRDVRSLAFAASSSPAGGLGAERKGRESEGLGERRAKHREEAATDAATGEDSKMLRRRGRQTDTKRGFFPGEHSRGRGEEEEGK